MLKMPWIFSTMNREFGTSDTQSNYSRLYVWMANQLGHMSLGLIVALFCYWSRETILAFIDRFAIDWREARFRSAENYTLREGAPPYIWDDVNLETFLADPLTPIFQNFFEKLDAKLLAFSVVIGAMIFIFALARACRDAVTIKSRSLGHDVDYVALLEHQQKIEATGEPQPSLSRLPLAIGLFILLSIAFALFLLRDWYGGFLYEHRGEIDVVAHLFAPATLACIVVSLARTLRYVLLGWTMLAAAASIGLGLGEVGADDPFALGDWVMPSLFALFVLLSGMSCEVQKDFADKIHDRDKDIAREYVGDAGESSRLGSIIAAIAAALMLFVGYEATALHAIYAPGGDPDAYFSITQALMGFLENAFGWNIEAFFIDYDVWTLYGILACALLFGGFWLIVDKSLDRPHAYWRLSHHRFRDREFFVLFCFTAFGASLLLAQIISTNGLSKDYYEEILGSQLLRLGDISFDHENVLETFRGWRTGISIFLMSVALWWVKEFGNDLILAEVELRDAEKLRLINEDKELKQETVDDYPPGAGGRRYTRLERQYIRDAKWDSRTDATFYFCGAWIAAGVVTGDPVMTDGSWNVGSELVGLVVFILFFLWRGAVWAARQDAIDHAKVPRSRRLITLQTAVQIFLPDAARAGRFNWRRLLPERDKIMPLNWLFVFATRKQDTAETFRRLFASHPTEAAQKRGADEIEALDRIKHLVIVGEYGSSRTLLGVAMACDGTLAPLQLGRLRLSAPKPHEVRYAHLNQIALHNRLELAFAPNIALDPERAQLLVIDDVDPNRDGEAKVRATIDAARLFDETTIEGLADDPTLFRKCVWILNFSPADGSHDQEAKAYRPVTQIAALRSDEADQREYLVRDPDSARVIEIFEKAEHWINTALAPALQKAYADNEAAAAKHAPENAMRYSFGRMSGAQPEDEIAVVALSRRTREHADNEQDRRTLAQLREARQVEWGRPSLWR